MQIYIIQPITMHMNHSNINHSAYMTRFFIESMTPFYIQSSNNTITTSYIPSLFNTITNNGDILAKKEKAEIYRLGGWLTIYKPNRVKDIEDHFDKFECGKYMFFHGFPRRTANAYKLMYVLFYFYILYFIFNNVYAYNI